MSALLNEEKQALGTMSDTEIVAYWNILQFPTINVDPEGKRERHIALVSEILVGRGIAHEVGKRTVAVDPQTARAIVCDYLYHGGSCRTLLSNEEHMEVYCLADGFGRIGREALDMHYDWSHVRDSSDRAMREMAAKITEIVNGRGV
jgi:hypothetical protein